MSIKPDRRKLMESLRKQLSTTKALEKAHEEYREQIHGTHDENGKPLIQTKPDGEDTYMFLSGAVWAIEQDEPDFYCPICGSCGEEHCCDPTKCLTVRASGIYCERNQRAYDSICEEVDALRSVLAGLVPQLDPKMKNKVLDILAKKW